MNNNILVSGVVLCALFIAACSDEEPQDIDRNTHKNGAECPDVESHEDPLVRVVSVVDSSSKDSLSQVTFSELTFDQQNYNFGAILGGPSGMERLDVSSDGQSVVCTVPCGLFAFEGEYSMLVHAPSFEPKRIEFEPAYESDGGPPCRNQYSGSYELSITLDPEPQRP